MKYYWKVKGHNEEKNFFIIIAITDCTFAENVPSEFKDKINTIDDENRGSY